MLCALVPLGARKGRNLTGDSWEAADREQQGAALPTPPPLLLEGCRTTFAQPAVCWVVSWGVAVVDEQGLELRSGKLWEESRVRVHGVT